MTAVVNSQAAAGTHYKIPQSVLVVIYTPALDVLLMQRADTAGDYWQSVTGSRQQLDEPLAQTAVREVREETGIAAGGAGAELTDWGIENRYPLDPRWKARFAPGVTHNVEHVFGLRVVAETPVHLNPREHTRFVWLPWADAALRCASSTNARACRALPERAGLQAT